MTLRPAPAPVAIQEAPDDFGWASQELAAVRLELESDVARLRAEMRTGQSELASSMNPLRAGGGDDSMALASHAAELEQQLRTLDNVGAVLAQTELALKRLVDGCYPSCEACAQPVGKARQEAFPRAVTCLRCQQRRDRRSSS
ncbi:MAG TPA: TraR/DksA C4-type zinc finger protein [Candidatus Nanopelagicales bacterium]